MRQIHLLAALLLAFCLTIATPSHAQTCAQGAAGVAPTATLTFPAVSLNTDGTAVSVPVTYNLYQGTSATTLVKVASNLVAGAANTIKTGILPNSSTYWAVTAVDSLGTEGAQSNVACKTFPKSVPGTTTITIT